jgi:hypothetical protein
MAQSKLSAGCHMNWNIYRDMSSSWKSSNLFDDQGQQQNYPEEKPKENKKIMDVHKFELRHRTTR